MIVKVDNSEELKNIIHSKLRKFNRSKCKWLHDAVTDDINTSSRRDCNFLIYDEDKLVGGAIGFVEYRWYFLDLLYIDEEYRNRKLGSCLLHNIDRFAYESGLVGIRTETWDFQAKGFYEKNGYSVFGEIKNCPPGTVCYFLKKENASFDLRKSF